MTRREVIGYLAKDGTRLLDGRFDGLSAEQMVTALLAEAGAADGVAAAAGSGAGTKRVGTGARP